MIRAARRACARALAAFSPFGMYGPRFDPLSGRPTRLPPAPSREVPAGPGDFDRFGLLALTLSAAADEEAEQLAALDAIEAKPRPFGRSHGLEFARETRGINLERLRQARALILALAPHEAEVRALLARPQFKVAA